MQDLTLKHYGNTVGITHTNGQSGNITQVTSPNGRWIKFTYDASNRITQAQDNSCVGWVINPPSSFGVDVHCGELVRFPPMPTYTRADVPGGTFFFTVVTYHRQPILTVPPFRQALHAAIQQVRVRSPFRLDAIVLLPDHLHTIWTLPAGDSDFSTQWRLIKAYTTHALLPHVSDASSQSRSRWQKKEQPVWQRRFWEHAVRGEEELAALSDYLHSNPIKHGVVSCPHAWPYSSFHRFVRAGYYTNEWLCSCAAGKAMTVSDELGAMVGE